MLVFIGITMLSISTLQNVQVGGVVMIGPIPIVFGTSPSMALFALIVVLVFIVFSLFVFRV
jgi:uncharacterized protein (TIGR00304 family)